MTIAVYNGLLSPASDDSSLISIQCSSGNCTFPSENGASYTSLAICHDVQDISHYIQNATTNATSSANYTLSNGTELFYTTMLSSTVPDYSNDTFASEPSTQNLTNDLFTFEALMYTCDVDSEADCTLPFAVRASIYPCVKTYGGNITKSVLSETTISSIPLTLNSRGDFTIATNATIRNGSLSNCTAKDESQTSNYSVAVYGDVSDTSNSSSSAPGLAFITAALPNDTVEWYAPDCTYSMSLEAQLGISHFLDGLFNNNNLTSPYGQYYDVTGPLWLTNLYLNGTANISTVNNYMQGLTNSMTAVIRARGDPASTGYTNYASGMVYENQTCIHVQWGWLALPAVLVFIGIGFLAATIVLTSTQCSDTSNGKFLSENHGPFKSSPLALLSHGIDPQQLQTLPQPQSVAEMEVLAEKMKVARCREKDGGSTYLVTDR